MIRKKLQIHEELKLEVLVLRFHNQIRKKLNSSNLSFLTKKNNRRKLQLGNLREKLRKLLLIVKVGFLLEDLSCWKKIIQTKMKRRKKLRRCCYVELFLQNTVTILTLKEMKKLLLEWLLNFNKFFRDFSYLAIVLMIQKITLSQSKTGSAIQKSRKQQVL